jgi:hypothetical protein
MPYAVSSSPASLLQLCLQGESAIQQQSYWPADQLAVLSLLATLFRRRSDRHWIIAHHTTPREARLVFSKAKPKMAVYTHIVLQGSKKFPEPALDEFMAETR